MPSYPGMEDHEPSAKAGILTLTHTRIALFRYVGAADPSTRKVDSFDAVKANFEKAIKGYTAKIFHLSDRTTRTANGGQAFEYCLAP